MAHNFSRVVIPCPKLTSRVRKTFVGY
jgi:hypothetical protein